MTNDTKKFCKITRRIRKIKMTKTLSIDPGKMTGVVILDIIDPMNPKVDSSYEWDVPSFFDKAEELISSDEVTTVVFENYVPDNSNVDFQPHSLHLIGVILYLCYKYEVDWISQSRTAKAFCDNDRLRHLGFWHKGGGGHANDAFRHAVVAHLKQNPKWATKLILKKD